MLLPQQPLRHVARPGVREVERAHEPAAADVRGHAGVPLAERDQFAEEPVADLRRVLEQPVALDDLQEPAGADHVGEPAAPGRVDPAGHREHVLGDLVHPAPAMIPPSCTFLANATMSGSRPSCW